MAACCSCEKRESGKEGVKTNECLQHEIKLFCDRGSGSAVSGTRHRSSWQKCSSALPRTTTKRRPREKEGRRRRSDAEQDRNLSVIWARGPLVSCCRRECGRTGSLNSTESGRDELKKSEAEETTRTEDVLRTEAGGTDLSLGMGQLAPMRRAKSLTLHVDRLTLAADSGVTAASQAEIT